MVAVPNPIWDLWVSQPSYDDFWRSLTPSLAELGKLNIPVLTTTGYYDSGQSGALSYWIRYVRANPMAQHYLVIGPWDHHTAQIGTVNPMGTPYSRALRTMPLDDAGQFDIIALRYQWFDWVFGRGPNPAVLQDQVNYEVMGENKWHHSRSVDAMGSPRRYFLSSGPARDGYVLSDRPERQAFVPQAVLLKDRSDVE